MTKPELIDKIASSATLAKKDTELIVNTVFEDFTATLTRGDEFELRTSGASGSGGATPEGAETRRRTMR